MFKVSEDGAVVPSADVGVEDELLRVRATRKP